MMTMTMIVVGENEGWFITFGKRDHYTLCLDVAARGFLFLKFNPLKGINSLNKNIEHLLI